MVTATRSILTLLTWPASKASVLNLAATFVGIFAFKVIFEGMSSETVLALASAWWLALYVGRFASPNWVSVLISVVAISAISAVLQFVGLQSLVAVKPANDASSLAATAISNGVLFSTPLVVNILVDKLVGMFSELNGPKKN